MNEDIRLLSIAGDFERGVKNRPIDRRTSIEDLIWTTAEGQAIRLGDMNTGHLFNSMKMLFNHLASVHGGQPVWFTHVYSDTTVGALTAPKHFAKYVLAMLRIIEKRTDLPAHYAAPLAIIRAQVFAEGPVALQMPAEQG